MMRVMANDLSNDVCRKSRLALLHDWSMQTLARYRAGLCRCQSSIFALVASNIGESEQARSGIESFGSGTELTG